MERLSKTNVLVTGGTGLVGSHLVELLLERSCTVVVLTRSCDPRSYFSNRNLGKRTILAYGDLKDRDRIYDVVTKYEINYIFHLGAQAIVPTAYINPWETYQSNILGTVNILEAARLSSLVSGVVIASSDKAYGKKAVEYTETDPLRGDHPYEASKSAADIIATSYYMTYKLPIVIARFGNIYGPGDLNFNRIIPGMCKAAITGETLVLRSDGTPVRDYVYVKDVVSGYLFLMDHLTQTTGEAYNLSSYDSLTVDALIAKFQAISGIKVIVKKINNSINEIPYQHLNFDKIKRIGWKPEYSLDKGLELTFDWYKVNKPF